MSNLDYTIIGASRHASEYKYHRSEYSCEFCVDGQYVIGAKSRNIIYNLLSEALGPVREWSPASMYQCGLWSCEPERETFVPFAGRRLRIFLKNESAVNEMKSAFLEYKLTGRLDEISYF